MAHRFHLNSEHGYIIVRYWGVVDVAELEQVRLEIEADPGFKPGMNRVWDERDCDIDISHDDLVALAEGWSSTSVNHGKRKLAYLVKEDLSWGFNRVFEAYRHQSDVEYKLFRDFAEVRQWLPLPDDVPDPRDLLPNSD